MASATAKHVTLEALQGDAPSLNQRRPQVFVHACLVPSTTPLSEATPDSAIQKQLRLQPDEGTYGFRVSSPRVVLVFWTVQEGRVTWIAS